MLTQVAVKWSLFTCLTGCLLCWGRSDYETKKKKKDDSYYYQKKKKEEGLRSELMCDDYG